MRGCASYTRRGLGVPKIVLLDVVLLEAAGQRRLASSPSHAHCRNNAIAEIVGACDPGSAKTMPSA
jgi:hypothetical protein